MIKSTIYNPHNSKSLYYFVDQNKTKEAIDKEFDLGVLFENNILHRIDGPAATYSIFEPDWFIMGVRVIEKEYRAWLKDMGMDIKNLSSEDETLIIMKWGSE